MQLPRITKKQKEIVALIYKFRYLNRVQIQKILKHKDARRINAWARDLVNKGYLGRIFINKIPLNTIPAKYYLGKLGIKYLRKLKDEQQVNNTYLKRLHHEAEKSDYFKAHHLLIADIYIKLAQSCLGNQSTFVFATQSRLVSDEITSSFKPHIYIMIADKYGKAKRYFIELVGENMPRFAIRARIRAYLDFYLDGTWKDHFRYAHPHILFIVPKTRKIDRFVYRYTKRILEEEEIDDKKLKIYTADLDKVTRFGIDDELIRRQVETY